jgi:alpha-glucosidase
LVPRLGKIDEIEEIEERQTPGEELRLPGRDLLYPEYAIHNAAGYSNTAGGGISNHTVNTDLRHQNGLAMYDTHNLYGTSKFPRHAIENT